MENNSPHSAHERARIAEAQIASGHYNRKTGVPRPLPRPTEHEVAILRRIARGYLLASMEPNGKGETEPVYRYDDGTPIHDIKARRLASIERFVNNGWIVGVKGESLFEDGTPQRYVVPKP